MAKRRGKPPPRDPNRLESDQRDGLHWPTLRSTWAGLSAAEIAEHHRRAKQLCEGGYGAVECGKAGFHIERSIKAEPVVGIRFTGN